MQTQLRELAIQLRIKDRLSYGAIREKLGVSKSTLSYWLQDYPLSEHEIKRARQRAWLRGEASRERYRNTMRLKKVQLDKEVYCKYREQMINISKESFLLAGLMLYLGEGDKKNKSRVGLANSDPAVIKFFIKWLTDFMNVKKDKIHVELHLYENMDIKEETLFWEKIVNLPEKQFYKTQVRKIREGAFSYQGKQNHGTCSVIFPSVEKKREIMMAIKALLDLYEQKRI